MHGMEDKNLSDLSALPVTRTVNLIILMTYFSSNTSITSPARLCVAKQTTESMKRIIML